MVLLFDSLLLDIGVIGTLLLGVVYIYFQYAYSFWKKQNVPSIKPVFPVGNFMDSFLMRKPIGFIFKDIYDKLEGEKFGGTYMLAQPGFIFRDPELIKNVLVKDFSNFHDRGFYMNEEVEPLTGHLFLLPGNRWKNLRVKLSPTFTSGKMKMMFQTLVDCGQELRECLVKDANKGGNLEIKDVLARYSTDIISSCAFGIQCNCLKNPDAEFRQWGRKIFSPTIRNSIGGVLSALAPSLMKSINFAGLDPEISHYFRAMVRDTVEYREKNNIQRKDFMKLLIQIKNKGKVTDNENEEQNGHKNGHALNLENSEEEGLSMDCLAAQAFVFFVAGFETSSTTMTFCLYELSINPNIQSRLRQEIDAVLKKNDGKITYEAISEMDYLDRVVSETLRKYPPVPILNRECTKDYKLPDSDIVLKKGMLTVIPVLALQHDPKFYPNPEKFDPERFTEEEKAKRHHYSYLPFGEGPRICIGLRFGLMQTKVGLVSLLSKYEFSVCKTTPIPLVLDNRSFILSPVGGMWLQIKNRSS